MNKLERNRVFDQEKLKELEKNCVKLMIQAVNTSQNTEKELSKLKEILGRVPLEAKEHRLQSDIDRISGKLNKQVFTTCRTQTNRTISKLMTQIPSQDKSMGIKVNNVKDDAKQVEKAAQDLRKLVSSGVAPGNYQEFVKKIENLRGSWQIKEVIKKDILAAAIQRMKQLNGKDPVNEYSIDPVNLSTGNFIYEKEDLLLPGMIPLVFKRFYNALDDREGSLGTGWIHNYEVRLIIEEDTSCVLIREEGGQEGFVKESNRLYRSLRSGLEKIQVIEADGLENSKGIKVNNYIYTDKKGLCYTFDEQGYLLSQKDANGNTIRLHYNEERKLVKVSSDWGSTLNYTYHPGGRLSSVADHAERKVILEYQKGNLHIVKDPEGNVICYRYDKKGKVSGITSPRGITTLSNKFDKHGRIVSQRFPDGGEMQYEYQDKENQILLTERNGNRTIYIHDDKYRSIKNIYENGEEYFSYNDRDEKVLYRDKNGNETRYSYDNRGNLSGMVNPLGYELKLDYEEQFDKISSVSLNGRIKLKNEYDNHGNLRRTTDAVGRAQDFFYNDKGLITKVCQTDGSFARFSFDSQGNLTGIWDQRGRHTEYEYDSLNRVIRTVDGNRNETHYKYNQKNLLTEVCNPEGNKQYYSYNESGKVTAIRRFDGRILTCEYNEINRPRKIMNASGNETVLEYDKMWNVSKRIDPNGAETRYHYNGLNQLKCVEDPLGGQTSYEYDPNGNCTRIIEADGKSTSYRYDALNRRIEIKQPGDQITQYVYDQEGRITKVINALGVSFTYDYNEEGQIIKETDAAGNTHNYTYNKLGQVLTITDPVGRKTRNEYHRGGLLAAVYGPDGSWEKYTYDRNHNVTMVESAKGGTIRYVYDSLNRVTSIIGCQGQKIYYRYDEVGKLISMKDALGNKNFYRYDGEGNLISMTDALGGEIQYRYDAAGNLIESCQFSNIGSDLRAEQNDEFLKAEEINRKSREIHKMMYKRNKLGQVESITNALGASENYSYDIRGRVIEKKDQEGYITRYRYTQSGDLESLEYADGRKVRLSYDALRRLEEIEDWLGITRIERDNLSRPVRISDHKGREVGYKWGKAGEKRGVIYPGGKQVTYGYDEYLRLNEVNDGDSQVNYEYDISGQLIKKAFSNGIKTEYTYNSLGQMESLLHWIDTEICEQYRFRYDLMGNKTGIEKKRQGLSEESGIYEYDYDPLHRLYKVKKDGELLRKFSYDGYGNRTGLEEGGRVTCYSYNEGNQLVTKIDTEGVAERYTYDLRGNMTEVWENEKRMKQYWFGPLNRLEKTVNFQSGQGAEYIYNGIGHRVEKVEGSFSPNTPGIEKPELLNLNPNSQIEDVLDLTRAYHNLLERREGEGTSVYTWDMYGNAAEVSNLKGKYSYLHDDLGSPLRIIDKKRRIEEVYGYDEFGSELIKNQIRTQPFTFTGYQYDRVTDTYSAQARDYAPSLGRMLSEDPIKSGNNWYVYCDNNPANFVDLLGLEKVVVSGGIYSQDKREDNAYYYEFIDAAIAQIQEWNGAGTNEQITWAIADHGWSDLNKSEFDKAAEHYNVNLVFISDTNDLINYANYQTTNNMNLNAVSANRKNDPITDFSLFSHGLSNDNGLITLGFDYSGDRPKNLDVGIADIDSIYVDAFSNPNSDFYSCNTGTAGKDSFAQLWVNRFGGVTTAFKGQSNYTNCPDSSLGAKIMRRWFKLRYGVSGFGGNPSLPVTADGAEQITFDPNCSD